MRKTCLVLSVLALVVSAPLAWAQRPQRGGFGGGAAGGGLFLLAQESVQKELDLSADQIKQVDDFLAKQREEMSGLRDLDQAERREKLTAAAEASRKALGSILNEQQTARYEQISLQQRGGQALADPRIGEALGLSDDQKSKVREILEDSRDEMRSLFEGGGGDREAMREKFQKLRDEISAKMMGVLDSDQQSKWKEMIGKPFSGEIRARRGLRGGAGAGAGRRRNRNSDAGAALPEPAASVFRLASFRNVDEDDNADDDGDDDAKKPAKRRKDAQRGAKSGKAKKPGMAQASSRGPKAHRAGRPQPHRSHAARQPRGERDHAWARVAQMMRHRGGRTHAFGPARPGRGFAAGPERHRHMAWGGSRPFGPPRHAAHVARFGHGRRPGWGFAQASRHGWHDRAHFGHHRGAMMAHRGGRHGGPSMAGRGFGGHRPPHVAHHRPHSRPGFAMAQRPHGPPAGFARHRGGGPTRMASFKGGRHHGPGMGQHHPHHRGGSAQAPRDRDDDHSRASRRRGSRSQRDRDRDDDDDKKKDDDD